MSGKRNLRDCKNKTKQQHKVLVLIPVASEKAYLTHTTKKGDVFKKGIF